MGWLFGPAVGVGGSAADGSNDQGDGREYRGELDCGEGFDGDAGCDAEDQHGGYHRQDDDRRSVAHSVLVRLRWLGRRVAEQ